MPHRTVASTHECGRSDQFLDHPTSHGFEFGLVPSLSLVNFRERRVKLLAVPVGP